MARTANVFTRVDPDIKEQAEVILEQLGIPMSNAVGMFLRQVVMQRGIPFEMKLPTAIPIGKDACILPMKSKRKCDGIVDDNIAVFFIQQKCLQSCICTVAVTA